MKDGMKGLSETLVSYSHNLSFDDLDESVIVATKRFLLDTLGSIIVGSSSEPYKIAHKVFEQAAGSEQASAVGRSRKLWTPHAALVNGVSLRYTEYSGHLLYPGVQSACHCDENVPAALAVAEYTGASGREVLISLALAAELQSRFLEAMDMTKPKWHHTTVGIYVVPLFVARLLNLTQQQSVHALGISGSFGLTLDQLHYIGPVSMTRNIAYPLAAQQGIIASLLAREGFTGPRDIIEGELGLLSYDPCAKPERLTELEAPSRILHYYNKLASTSGMMALVDATRNLRREHDLKPDQIKRVLVRMSPIMVRHSADPGNRVPQGKKKESADHSAYFVVARTLIDGDLTIDQFTEEKIVDPEVRRLIDRIEVVGDPKLARMKETDPIAQPFKVEIETTDGHRYECLVDHARGYGRNRLDDAELKDKFRFLSSKELPHAAVEEIIEFVDNVDNEPNVDALMELLRASGQKRRR